MASLHIMEENTGVPEQETPCSVTQQDEAKGWETRDVPGGGFFHLTVFCWIFPTGKHQEARDSSGRLAEWQSGGWIGIGSGCQERNYWKKGMARLQTWPQVGGLGTRGSKEKTSDHSEGRHDRTQKPGVSTTWKSDKGERCMFWNRRQWCSSWPSWLVYDPDINQCWTPKSWKPRAEAPAASQSASTATVQDTELAVLNIFPSAAHPTLVISIYNMPLKFWWNHKEKFVEVKCYPIFYCCSY